MKQAQDEFFSSINMSLLFLLNNKWQAYELMRKQTNYNHKIERAVKWNVVIALLRDSFETHSTIGTGYGAKPL